jgi:hypothetical protein
MAVVVAFATAAALVAAALVTAALGWAVGMAFASLPTRVVSDG